MTIALPRVAGRFIDGPAGPLAAVVWHPPQGQPVRFGVLHVPPAGDELNKSRRTIAIQAREFARRGGIVAVVDLRGMGDSAGEHGDATWAGWRADVEAAWAWLREIGGAAPTALWGLRLGGLLSAELVVSGRISPDALLLWQPVISGRVFFNQWLRIATTQQMTSGGPPLDANALRERMAAGLPVEVAGYDLHPQLVAGAEAVDLSRLPPPSCHVAWVDTTPTKPLELSPAAARVKVAWSSGSGGADFSVVPGPSFWATQELADSPNLVVATTDALVACLCAEQVRG